MTRDELNAKFAMVTRDELDKLECWQRRAARLERERVKIATAITVMALLCAVLAGLAIAGWLR